MAVAAEVAAVAVEVAVERSDRNSNDPRRRRLPRRYPHPPAPGDFASCEPSWPSLASPIPSRRWRQSARPRGAETVHQTSSRCCAHPLKNSATPATAPATETKIYAIECSCPLPISDLWKSMGRACARRLLRLQRTASP